MKEQKNCPSCHSVEMSPKKGFERHHLLKCPECSLVFSRYIPGADELTEHYEGYGRNDYLSPVTTKRYNDLLSQFEPYRKNGKMLDIGCGMGFFSEVAAARNWTVYGTEYTDEAVTLCRKKGIQMFKGDITEIDFDNPEFDVITSFEVLEHISNPAEHVEKISSLLRRGGLLYLTTPNFNSLNRRILKDAWNVISYPEHLSYYTKESVHHLLSSHGLKKKRIQTDGLSPGRWIKSKKKEEMDFSDSESPDEKIRSRIEENSLLLTLKKIVNYILNTTSLGENLKVWYERL